jgi:hypothetical protein
MVSRSNHFGLPWRDNIMGSDKTSFFIKGLDESKWNYIGLGQGFRDSDFKLSALCGSSEQS